jgi:hypothetical protein
MWILHFLPDSLIIWFIHIVMIVGAASAIAGYFFVGIPYIGSRRTLFQILGVALLIAGVYLKGGYSAEMQWRDRVAEVEAKVKVAEEKAKKANTQVQTKIVTKIVKIQEKATVAKETIRRNKEVINRECKLSDEAISAYNFSITKTKPQEKK